MGTIGFVKWIRKRVGIVAGAAIAGFLLWLVGTVVSIQTTQAESVGLLFGKKVPFKEFMEASQAVTHQAILTHGDRFQQEVTNDLLEAQAWERLTYLAEAKRLKIRVSDQEVVEEIQNLFQSNGQFDRKGYETVVQYLLGTSPRAFEEGIRGTLTIRKLLDQALENPTVTEEELKKTFHEREDKIQISYLVLSQEPLAREIAESVRQDWARMKPIAKQLDAKIQRLEYFKRTEDLPELGYAGSTFGPAFSLQPGEVTGPVSSQKGWLVVKLEDQRPADEENLPAMRETLEKQITNQKRLMAYFSWYSDLRKRANLKKKLEAKS